MSDAAQLRRQAHHILSGAKYRGRRTPAPFRGVLRAGGREVDRVLHVLAPVGHLIRRVWSTMAGKLVLSALVLAVVVAIALALAHRRSVAAVSRRAGTAGWDDDDPAALERDAARAEANGDFDVALRLRFRAGLARLHQAGRVRLPRTVTTGAVSRQLSSPTFDDLGRTFDAVAYGKRPATAGDAATARERWPRVLVESEHR